MEDMKIFLQRYTYRAMLLFMLIYLLTACSSTRLMYTFVDKFIENEITYFLDLNEKEVALLNKEVSKMVAWHRKSMLPRYASYLNDIADKLEDNRYDANYITKILVGGRSLVEETVIGLIPYASKFLIRHQTIEAIEFMKKRMTTRQHERLTELSKAEDIQYEDRLERLTSNFERFFGELNDAQVVLLEGYVRYTLGDSKTRLHNRTLRQKAFINFLKIQPTEAELTTYLNNLLLRGHVITNPEYKDFSEAWLDRFKSLLVNMFQISSTEQRDTIISKLRAYAEDFKTVSE